MILLDSYKKKWRQNLNFPCSALSGPQTTATFPLAPLSGSLVCTDFIFTFSHSSSQCFLLIMFSTPDPRLFVDFLHIQEQFCENKKHSTHPGLNNRTWTRRLKRFSVHITFKRETQEELEQKDRGL